MRHPRGPGKFRQMGDVPLVIAHQRLLVRIFGRESQHPFRLFNGDEGILRGGFVHPFVEGREFEFFQQAQAKDHRAGRRGHDFLAESGMIEHSLIILAHRLELFGADVEDIIHPLLVQRGGEIDGVAEVFHIEQLVAIAPAAQHGETLAIFGPVVEQGEDAQPFRADKGFGADNGDAHALRPEFPADLFGLDFGLAVGPHAIQGIILVQGMVVGDAVDRGGGDVDETLDPMGLGCAQHRAQAVDVGGSRFPPACRGAGPRPCAPRCRCPAWPAPPRPGCGYRRSLPRSATAPGSQRAGCPAK